MAITSSWDAIVLAGGTSSRMKQDKATLKIGGISLLGRTVNALGSARRIIVSGEQQPLQVNVTWSMEDPPQSGPVAAISAALKQVSSDWIMIVPCDLARPKDAIDLLSSTDFHSDALVARENAGRVQWLTALVNTNLLQQAVMELGGTDVPARAMFENLNVTFVEPPVNHPHIWEDMDTPRDLTKAR